MYRVTGCPKGSLFTLQKVSVNWLTSKYQLNSVKDYELVDEIKMGQSIFLVQKDEIISTLEKNNPYLRVVSIETKFPNKLVIHSAERESLFAVKLSDNEYVDKIADFFESLTTSKEFLLLEDGTWDLKSNHKIKMVIEEIDDESENVESEEDEIEIDDVEPEELDMIDDDSYIEDDTDDDLADLTIIDDEELED